MFILILIFPDLQGGRRPGFGRGAGGFGGGAPDAPGASGSFA